MRVPVFWDTLYRRSQGKHRRSRDHKTYRFPAGPVNRLLKHSLNHLRQANAHFTFKDVVRFSRLQFSGASYSTFYREVKTMRLKLLKVRKKGCKTKVIVQSDIILPKNNSS